MRRLFMVCVIVCLLLGVVLPGLTQNDVVHEMEYDGLTRSYRLHLPADYDGSTPLPLILGLHGGTGTARHFERTSGLADLVDEFGFIAVLPDGTGRLQTWNAGYCCGAALRDAVDDVGFIRALIENLQAEYNIDPARIYVMGHSNGAMLAYRLGAELSDVLAAIGPVSGTIGGQAKGNDDLLLIPAPTEPVSVIAIHGREDEAVPYDGGFSDGTFGSGRVDVAVADSIAFWREYNNCSTEPEITTANNLVYERSTCTPEGVEVVLITIEDGGHTWPSTRVSQLRSDPDSAEFDAARKIVTFFLAHPKND